MSPGPDGLLTKDEWRIMDLEAEASDLRREIRRLKNELAAQREETLTAKERHADAVQARIQAENKVCLCKNKRPEFVYFMRCGSHVKIGFSKQPDKRLKQIRAGLGCKMPDGVEASATELLKHVIAPQAFEYELHRQFKELRTDGEWFRAEPALIDYIDSLEGEEVSG